MENSALELFKKITQIKMRVLKKQNEKDNNC